MINPFFLILPCTYCPFRDDIHEKGEKRESDLREENSRLRQRMIDAGIECGGLIYVGGQKRD
jgi:hypothetical protein